MLLIIEHVSNEPPIPRSGITVCLSQPSTHGVIQAEPEQNRVIVASRCRQVLEAIINLATEVLMLKAV